MPNQVLENFRTKYPKYKDVNDVTLANGIIAKYPQYQTALTDVLNPASPPTGQRPVSPAFQAGVQDIGQTAQKGFEQLTSNPFQTGGIGRNLAGLMNLQSLPLRGVGTAVSTALEPVRQVPVLGDIVGAVESGLGKVGDLGGELYSQGVGRILPQIGVSPETTRELQEPARFFGGAAAQTALTAGVGTGVGMAGKVIPKALPRKLVRTALKPSPTNPIAAEQQVTNVLKTKSPVSLKSAERIANRIDELNAQVKQEIGKARVTRVPANEILKVLQSVRDYFSRRAEPQRSFADIDQVSEIVRQSVDQQGFIPLDVVNNLKVDFYKRTAQKQGFSPDKTVIPKSEATVAAEKAISRAAREAVIKRAPKVKGLLDEESKLLSIQKPIATAAERASSQRVRDMVGLGSVIRGGALGYAVNPYLGAAVLLGESLLGRPRIGSGLGIALEQIRRSARPRPTPLIVPERKDK